MIDQILRNAIYYIEAFLKRPLWVIGPAVATVAIGAGAFLALPRSYQSEAQILIEAPQSPTSLVPSTVATEHLQFVEQRVLARDKLLALAEKIHLFPGLRNTMSETKLAQLIRQNISINTMVTEPSDRYSGTAAMRIGFTGATAEQASATVAELVSMIIQESRGLRIQRASEMSEFLSREVDNMAGMMKARAADWNAFFEQNSDALPARVEGVENEIQEKDRELTSLDQSIATLDQELRLLEAELRLQRPEAAVRDRTQLAELESELATKSLTYSDAHPEIRALSKKIEGMRQKIASASVPSPEVVDQNLTPEMALVAERVKIAKARHGSLVAKRAEVNERIALLQAIIARAPAVGARLEAIERERETLQRNLDEMRGRLSTARTGERLERDNSTGHVQVLEEPETPRYPSSPSRTRLLLLVMGGALAMGAGGLYLGDNLQRTIRGTFDLKAALAGSTLVVIPNWVPAKTPMSRLETVLSYIARAIGIDRRATT
ncbi:hypothetical protein LHFGNBLO_001650 [Mesorhizobium sp. AR10]|nr:hypothetical protein LHFGNBLO_001650 [Mesorhizobium sp. AR10]